MKEGWEIKKLGEVCENLDYKRIPITANKRSLGNIPYYGASGIVDYVSEYIFNEDLLCVSEDGANLLARTYPIAFSITGYTWVNNHAHVLRFANFYTQKFIEYYLNSISISKFVTGMAQPKLNQAMLNTIPIPFPPPHEQQLIVSILDQAFAAIDKAKANAEKNLKNAREIFESYLEGVFEKKGEDWEEKKLKELGIIQTGTTPKTDIRKNYGNFIPFIKPADVDFFHNGAIRYDNEGLSETGILSGRTIKNGSILMVCIGATIGKVGITNQDVSSNQQINSLTPNGNYEPKFIYYAMTSRNFQKKVIMEGKGAQATLPIINKSKWENLSIKLPKSKIFQQSISEELDLLQKETIKLMSVYQQKIDYLEYLKKSILQKAFAGEFTTSDSLLESVS